MQTRRVPPRSGAVETTTGRVMAEATERAAEEVGAVTTVTVTRKRTTGKAG